MCMFASVYIMYEVSISLIVNTQMNKIIYIYIYMCMSVIVYNIYVYVSDQITMGLFRPGNI